MIKAKNFLTFLFFSLLISVKSQTIIYEDLFGSSGNGGTNTSTATINGVAPNNTNWRYVEFENSFGPSWEFGGGNAILSNSYGVNRSFGSNMLYKGADGYYTAPGGLYEQSNNFTSVFKNNTSIIEWSINFRSPNEVPQGLTNGGAGFTGGAFVLGMESPTLRSCSYRTRGYAVIFGDASGAGNRVKLVHFIGGTTDNNCATNNQPHYTFFNWNSTNTTNCIISDDQNLTTSWYSVKIQYNPLNDEWRLFVRNDGGSPQDPQTLNDTHCKGVNVNSTYTTTNLPILGLYACLPDDNNLRTIRYDNLRIKSNVVALGCPSTTGLCGAYAACTTPTVTTQPATQSICSSGSATLTVAVNPSTGPFQWQYFDGANWSNVANNTPNGFSYTNQTTASLSVATTNANCGTFQYRVLAGSSGCQATSSAATLTILKATRIAPTGPQCSETALNFDACPSGATYSWAVTAPSGTNASPLNGAGQTYSFTPVNNTGSNQTFSVTSNITFQGLTCTTNFSPTIVSSPISGTITATSLSVCTGNTVALTSNGTAGGSWVSSNSSVATVSSSGIVTGVSPGNVTVTYSVNATAPCTGSSSSTLDLSVTPAPDAGVLSGNSNLCVGNSTTITSNGNTGGTWTSSNSSVATVDANGNVTAVSNGTAVITYSVTSATCNSSDIATYNINVSSNADAGTLSSSSANVCVGNTATISTTGTAGGTWTSSNTSIATIDANGIVTGVSPGTITITYSLTSSSCSSGNNTATLSIDVIASPDAGTINGSASVCQGSTTTLTSTGNTSGTWTSSNLGIATIDANGVVTGISPGTVTITYSVSSTSCGTSDVATLLITITAGSNAGTLSSTSINVCVGITATVSTTGTSGGTWTSSNTSIATIDANGIVTGISPGTITITYSLTSSSCSSANNTATLSINVIASPDAGILSGANSLCVGATTTISSNGNNGGTWSSSPAGVATVDANGIVTGISVGSVTITYSLSSTSCSTSDIATYVINVTPSANAGTLSGNSTLCSGTTSTITSNGNSGGTWTSSNASIATVNSNGVVTGISAGSITLSYSVNVAGCSNGDVESISITVNPTPTLTPISNQNLCSGTLSSPININVQPSSSNINWSNSTTSIGLAASGSNNIPSFIPINNSNTSLTATITVFASLNGCSSGLQTFNISVYNTPTVLASSNSPICVNGTINLSTSNGSNYSWQGPNGFISSSQSPILTNVTTAMSGTYSVSINSLTGNCPGTATVNVVVNPLPVVSASSNSPACIGGSIILNSNLNNANSYSWSGPNNFSSTLSNPVINNASGNMVGNYTLTVQNNQGCFNASVVSVNLLPQPSAPIVSSVRLCQFSQVNPLVAIPSTGGNLNWYGNNSNGGTATLNVPTPSSNTVGIYPFYVSQTVQGCESPRSLLNVTILPAPNGILNAIPPKCAPMCSRFILSTSNAINQFQWNMGNGIITTNNDTINHCYQNSGNYTVSVKITDTSGCFNTLQFPNWVRVNENPTASFSSTPNEVTLFDPEILFQNQSTGSSISSYNWNFGDLTGTTTSQENIYHTYTNAGVYTVTLIVRTNEGCSDTAKGIIEVLDDFNVYIPNSFTPNDDDVNEEFYPVGTGISENNYLMEIYDRWGELIFTSNKLSIHWKGLRKNGTEPVMQDTYIYRITLQSNKGLSINKIGQVKVIR